MYTIQIELDPSLLFQRQVVNLTVEGKTKRVIFETRYLYATDKWYVSLYEAQSGDPICTYVPLISSHDIMIDLFEPFAHKRIGWLVCVPIVDNPSTENPSQYNLSEFAIGWGDGFD